MTLAEPRPEVVAEALVQLRSSPLPGLPSGDVAYVFLHRTLDVVGLPAGVPGAEVVLRREEGPDVALPEAAGPGECAAELGFDDAGSCYGPVRGFGSALRSGERLELEVTLPDGGVLTGRTTLPERVELLGGGFASCVLPPGETVELFWNRSEGSAAYVVEAVITGLSNVFDPEEVEVEDPLRLLGLAISADDTTLVFPSEVGVFDRAELDREVALLLQTGLPPGTTAEVVVAAVDENYVNWVRGGNFNPSGQVRVPSVRGAGTGFFGSAATAGLSIGVRASTGARDCRSVGG